MFNLQSLEIPTTSYFLLGTIAMLCLTIGLIVFIIFHQRKVIRYQIRMQDMEAEQQKMLLTASIKLQEEERQRIAADLHDDAGPLLATSRLYLSENLVLMNKESQLESIKTARSILDEAIQLIRNISHSLMPPTLKNFGLESAVSDFFHKLGGAGTIDAFCEFEDYDERLPAESELLIFRIIQELINNILKHSGASFIHLYQYQHDETGMMIRLEHDGKGITHDDFIRLNRSKGGLGLKNIQSRLKVVQGEIFFAFDNARPRYTTNIFIPRPATSEPADLVDLKHNIIA